MKLIWPKKPVSNELVRALKLSSDSKIGHISHGTYGLWFKYKGANIVYVPFNNGCCVKIKGAERVSIISDYHYCTSLCALIGLVRSLRQGGDV
jgi:hypothetical protein